MPVIGERNNEERIADVLEEICDKLDDVVGKETSVKVNVPSMPPAVVNVPSSPPPTVTVEHERPRQWVFTVHRNGEGLIETITARPNPK